MSIKRVTINSCHRVQHASSRLSNIHLINLPKIHSSLTLLSTVWLAFMAFYSAPCYKYGVQRWQVQRHQSKLTKQAIINHNQKCFIKNSPLQQRHTLWRLFWQRDTTKELGITYCHCRPHFQFKTTLLLFYLQFWQNLLSQLPNNYATSQSWDNQKNVCISSKTGKRSLM